MDVSFAGFAVKQQGGLFDIKHIAMALSMQI